MKARAQKQGAPGGLASTQNAPRIQPQLASLPDIPGCLPPAQETCPSAQAPAAAAVSSWGCAQPPGPSDKPPVVFAQQGFEGQHRAWLSRTTPRSGGNKGTPAQGRPTWHPVHNPSCHLLVRYPNHLLYRPVVPLHKKHRHRTVSAPRPSHTGTAGLGCPRKATAAPSYCERTQLRAASPDTHSQAGLQRSS